ncbi:MAG: acyl-CoA dehydrogenase family protein [Gammaproteobacteria bacterium]
MDLKFEPADEAFRQEVRAFAQAALPPAIKHKVEMGLSLTKDDYLTWQKILHAQGWIAPGWPVEHGGTGWTALQRYLFEEEMGLAGAPAVIPFGVKMVGPVLMAFGTEAQKSRYLVRILTSDDWWCQGYSEPGAGSDLASLKTRARLDDDHYVVNGAKTWTTYAQYADMMFCLVRTSDEGKKQQGISFLLIDMTSPGITVTPITTLDGGCEINQVFFDDVRVPVANLVGEEGAGWTVAKYLLGHERSNMAPIGRFKRELAQVRTIAANESSNGEPLIEDRRFRERLAEIEVELLALESVLIQVLSDESAGRELGPEVSLLKIKGTQMQQTVAELKLEALGPYAHAFQPEALEPGWNEEPIGPEYAASIAPMYFNWRKASIYGGSNEIQKNIIAKAVLGF